MAPVGRCGPEPNTEHSIIFTSLLIPGRGQPVTDAAVVISAQSKKIKFVGSQNSVPEEYSDAPKTTVPVLLPGLWDCHVHFIGMMTPDLSQIPLIHPATSGARLARSAADTLNAGYTSTRDMGGVAPEVAMAIDEGLIPGPHIYSAGAALSQTAGHGDLWNLPAGWVSQCFGVASATKMYNGIGTVAICDGVDECRKAVRLQLRRNAKVIKILASGGATSLSDNLMFQQFSDEELKIIVEEAERAKRVVAAHAYGKEAALAAIRAGAKTLEHGAYLDEECFNKMKELGVILVPTMTAVNELLKNLDLLSPESREKAKEMAQTAKAMYKNAIKAGVKIALGSDIALSLIGTGLSHGRNGAELVYAVESGMTPLQVIEAATATAPETLGPQAPLSGQIKEGYDADLIALDSNPLDDISVVNNTEKVTHVWKDGKLYKSPPT